MTAKGAEISVKTSKSSGLDGDILGNSGPTAFQTLDALSLDLANKPITFQRDTAQPDIKPGDEEAAFRALDSDLKELYKDLREQQEHYRQNLEVFGQDDPMTEIIADQLDSVRTAYETRLLELKSQHGIMAQSMSLYRSPEEEYFEEQLKKKRKRRLEIEREAWAFWISVVQKIKAAKSEQSAILVWAVIAAIVLRKVPSQRLKKAQARI